jgi:uncharacterized protein
LISFAIRPSRSFEVLFDHVAAHGHSLIFEDTIAELLGVLSREKFRRYIPIMEVMDYTEWYMAISELVVITESVAACRDPKDDKFLSLAIAGRADCIVAGDSDLLDMSSHNGIPIYSPADFIRLFVN